MCKPKLLACLTLLFSSGCATNSHEIDTSCSWVRPIMISKDDVLTDDTARQILMLDEQWQRVCKATAAKKGSTAPRN
jgi:hypothetical protein